MDAETIIAGLVRPLVWSAHNDIENLITAYDGVGWWYNVWPLEDGRFQDESTRLPHTLPPQPTLEAAQAAAQAYHVATIAAALDVGAVLVAADHLESCIGMIQHAIGQGKDVFIEPDTGRKLSDARAALAGLRK